MRPTPVYPKLKSPRGGGGLLALSHAPSLKALLPYYNADEYDGSAPRRKFMQAPMDEGRFIKPIKQSFIQNPRLSPGTRIMLALLSGWHGSGAGGFDTTIGIIAKALSRSRRMVHNYLQDAIAEGYLTYTRRKDRLGYYIGIRIKLNFAAIRKSFERKFNPETHTKMTQKSAESRDVKLISETNNNLFNTNPSPGQGGDNIMDILARMAAKAGYLPSDPPNMDLSPD